VMLTYRSLLDFIHLAQYPSHDDTTLGYMKTALDMFHKYKNVLVQLGIREHLDIPKFHSLLHYEESIRWFGTTDNYNTEMFERFHIDFAKEGWRASNKRDERLQMVRWLTRMEKVNSFQRYLKMTMSDEEDELIHSRPTDRRIRVTQRAHRPGQSIDNIMKTHQCAGFARDLKSFINSRLTDPLRRSSLQDQDLPFSTLDVYHGFKFTLDNLGNDVDSGLEEHNTIKCRPAIGRQPARFDTVVVMDSESSEATGVEGMFYFLMITHLNTDILNWNRL
jgi:hypothetical protein